MTQCNCKKSDNMPDIEASLKAKLLMKDAELNDMKQKYDKLTILYAELLKESKLLKSQIAENLDELKVKNNNIQFCEGKLAGFREAIRIFGFMEV